MREGEAAARRTSERLARPVDGLVVPIDVLNRAWAAFMRVRRSWPEAVLTSEVALSAHSTEWTEFRAMLDFVERTLDDVAGILFFDDPELGGVLLPLQGVIGHVSAYLHEEPHALCASTEDGATGVILDYGPDSASDETWTYSLGYWKGHLLRG